MKKKSPKPNKYSHLTDAQAEFDFHGTDSLLGESGIRFLTEKKIKEFKENNIKVFKLIVGKGHHSKNGPVIKPIVLKLLKELKIKGYIDSYKFDSAFGTGPNEGAIIIKF